jgi:hypothetical protein
LTQLGAEIRGDLVGDARRTHVGQRVGQVETDVDQAVGVADR